ncbi:MAG: Gfo/Idh/MocA family oxidoreductase [Verrucomicrobiales bacterium]|nr:Gfo/Idh/MocA family oxidoreductase [Verrucomicrobiales bacterium]MCP5528593.1 Gfo/Idh/MocA family oxidoreductase [Verrucomicrobiales bacterium]
MNDSLSRRRFLGRSAAWASLAATLPVSVNVLGANRRLRLAVMGLNGRGSALARGFAALEDVEVAIACEVDQRVQGKGADAVKDRQATAPRTLADFRQALDDPSVDALVIAAPDHWHAPATILACAAGKHVYVEKPASHNPAEGEWMLAAARRYHRVVQVGTQRRSMPAIIEAIGRVRAGELGEVKYARAWYNATRGSIGRGRQAPIPSWLDWDLWQGPAARRDFRDNLVHYNWHWFWHWGTGELGNNGIHALDLCRWGLDADYPLQVTSGGGRYTFADDQETPDTNLVTFDYGDKAIAWECQSCRRHGYEGSGFGAAFFGDQGTLVIDGGGCRFYDPADKETGYVKETSGDRPHLQDFVEAVREGRRPQADVEDGHKGALLCHLGNIAWRMGRALRCDPRNGRILNDAEAAALWEREYEPGWAPRV